MAVAVSTCLALLAGACGGGENDKSSDRKFIEISVGELLTNWL